MSADISDTRDLVNRFITQLLDGCESTVCSNQACHSGRYNTSNGEPVRRYTPRSARAIALVLAAEPDSESLLCVHEASAGKWPEGKQDPSDLVQLLADTHAVEGFLNGDILEKQFATDSTLHELHKLLDTYHDFYQSREVQGYLRNARALPSQTPVLELVELSRRCLSFLCEQLPILPFDTLDAAMLAQSQGFNVPIGIENCGAIQTWLDALSHEPSQRLCSRLFLAISRVNNVLNPPGVTTQRPEIVEIVLYQDKGSCWLANFDEKYLPIQAFYTTALLQRTFLAHWDGESIIGYASIEYSTLRFLQEMASGFIEQLGTYEWLAVIPERFRPDSVTLAESWLIYSGSSRQAHCKHLLNFRCVFTQEERYRVFRTVLHLRQRKAHSEAEMASALRRRLQPHVDEPETWRQQYHERHYFVLNVRRANALKDTFDQMWQRRKSELSLPLRVRLGEMEALEIGHDLGGVQIEFFNLVCKEAFSEDSQLFVTDADSGYHYFRPMSLEPLWRFEQVGALLALAVINGITLPVNFPRVFYRNLLSRDFTDPKPNHETNEKSFWFNHEWIQDGWPVLHRSLLASCEHGLDMDYAFPLEANGLQAAAFAGERPVHGKCPLTLFSPTRLGSAKLLDADFSISEDWPGWTVSIVSEEPEEVTPENRTAYLADYVQWLTEDSVWPQLAAFHRGFFSLVRPADLKIIGPSTSLNEAVIIDAAAFKLYIEGTPEVDLAALCRITGYENYSHTDPYIQAFWAMLQRWSADKVKKLVKFVTAAERLPLNMSSFKFIIKRTGAASGLLPTSSTCFSTLSLPQYGSVGELEEKLSLALEFGLEGFGTG